jgi:hypothetical protein
MFGLGFGATFRIGAGTTPPGLTVDPRDPAATDVFPISFTTDPVPVP